MGDTLVKSRLVSDYLPFVDDTDLGKLQPDAKLTNKLSRALAAYEVILEESWRT